MGFIYELKGWPALHWDGNALEAMLGKVRNQQGWLLGRMAGLGFELKMEASLESMTIEIVKSNEIEGEILDAEQVRSSIARMLGMEIAGLVPSERHVDGVVEMMLDATQRFDEPLTKERLFGWHAALFPTGRSGLYKITTGNWRKDDKGPMQVVSGVMGREKVHFQAPESAVLDQEMQKFLNWFNSPLSKDEDPVLRAGLAHLWFVTIHPFDDGNGRIARAIADMQLARADQSPQRFYSMSAQIRKERKEYYTILEQTQKGELDVTKWMLWFLNCLDRGLVASGQLLEKVLTKSYSWQVYKEHPLNARQVRMVNLMMDGFEGKLNSSKYAKINKCSQDTALREITQLLEWKVMEQEEGGGRNTAYKLKIYAEPATQSLIPKKEKINRGVRRKLS